MAPASPRSAFAALRSYVQGDPMRSLRLLFLVSLAISSAGLIAQIAYRDHGWAVIVACAAVQSFVVGLRAVEFRLVRPLSLWVDLIEYAAVFFVMTQVRDVTPVISTLFMAVLFRAAVGTLARLLISQAGYLTVWIVAAAMPLHVDLVPGAMISLPITSLMVYGMRTLMTKLQGQQKAQNALLEGVLTQLPFPVAVTDTTGNVILANPAVMDLLGWSRGSTLRLGDLRVEDLEERPVNLLDVVAGSGADGTRTKGEVCLVRADGTALRVVVQTIPTEQGLAQGHGVVVALADVTAQRSYEEYLHKAAYFDMLTGLPNRRLLFDRLEVAFGNQIPYALVLIDLNDFKVVNDTLGHKIGDELLAGVAQRILTAVDETATVARLGGDEFAVFLPHVTQAEAEIAARAVQQAFTEPLLLSCGPVQGKGSVGVSVATPAETPDQVLEKADAAMYLDKSSGKRRTRSPQGPRHLKAH